MADLIDRQVVLDYVLKDNYYNGGWFEIEEDKYVEWLKALPSVQSTTCIAKISFDDQQMKEMVDKAISNLDFSDLISRRAAIDAVEESRRLNYHQDGKEACAHEYEHRGFLKILHELPSVQPAQKWIPISEKLPEKDKYTDFYKCLVAVRCTSHNAICDSFTAYFDGKHFYRNRYDRTIISGVKAWMPLPQPYRAESEDDVIKRKTGTPREDYMPLYNCENWIP